MPSWWRERNCLHMSIDKAFASEAAAEEFYHAWTTEVVAAVPEDKLLQFDVKTNSWKPLCDFLRQPVPEEAFPCENKSSKYQASVNIQRKNRKLKELIMLVATVMVITGAIYLFATS